MAQQIDTAIQYHGKKRSAESEPEDQPLAKRFGRLHIEPILNPNGQKRHDDLPIIKQHTAKLADPMLLDDTRDTVFIHDIDREIAEGDTQEGTIDLLPGIAGTLLSIPKSLITDAKPQSNELVLYQEPTSLSIPKEQDSVRRAIAETRARARARQDSSYTNGSPAKNDDGIVLSLSERTRCHHRDDDDYDDDYDYNDDYGDDAMDIDTVS